MRNLKNCLSVPTNNQVQVRAQTESFTIFNTDSLIDLPDSTYIDNDIQSNVLPNVNIVHAEVQTKSLWKLFKINLKKLFCINSSGNDITPQDVTVANMVNNLDPSQNNSTNDLISESSESNIQEIAKSYDLKDEFNFGLAISEQNAVFDHKFIEGIDQYFISYNDIVLSVDPDLITLFI
jgi:hypothetical protein